MGSIQTRLQSIIAYLEAYTDEQITTVWSLVFILSLSISAIRNDDEFHHKQTFYIPHITQSRDTFVFKLCYEWDRKILFAA